MIGNDIVDLEVALLQKRANNQRFLNKIFTKEEQFRILESSNPEIKIWQFWSMKEAVYKAHQRQFNLSRTFNPKSFECYLNSKEDSGMVCVQNKYYRTQTKMNRRYVHTSVSEKNYFIKIYNSKVPKKNIIANIFPFTNKQKEGVKFFKNENGIPFISVKKSKKIYPISLSHHGSFTAFLFPLIKS